MRFCSFLEYILRLFFFLYLHSSVFKPICDVCSTDVETVLFTFCTYLCMHICVYVIISDLSLFLFLWVFKFIVAEMITPNQKDSEAVQSQTFLMKEKKAYFIL